MNEQEFFKLYISALEKALSKDHINHGYNVYGPDWYVEDSDVRNQMDSFEETNFEKYSSLFEKVAIYFDAKSHNFKTIEGLNTEEYKQKLKEEISVYKSKFNIL